jgi:hypothetical protein
MEKERLNGQFEVLTPWAEIDPVPAKRISSRLTTLEKKKIGFFCNPKRAARLILNGVEKKLKERYSSLETSFYANSRVNVPEIETENKESFVKWVKDVDAVILAVGD